MLSQVATGPFEGGGGGDIGRIAAAGAFVMSSAKVTQAMLALVAKVCILGLASTYAVVHCDVANTCINQRAISKCRVVKFSVSRYVDATSSCI